VDPLLVPADLAGAAPHCLRGRRRSSGWFSPSLSCRPVVLPDLHVQLTAPCHQPFAAVCLLGGWFPRIPGSGPGDGGSGKTGGCSWVVGLSRDISPYNRERGIRSNIPWTGDLGDIPEPRWAGKVRSRTLYEAQCQWTAFQAWLRYSRRLLLGTNAIEASVFGLIHLLARAITIWRVLGWTRSLTIINYTRQPGADRLVSGRYLCGFPLKFSFILRGWRGRSGKTPANRCGD